MTTNDDPAMLVPPIAAAQPATPRPTGVFAPIGRSLLSLRSLLAIAMGPVISLVGRFQRSPLYFRILLAMVLGVATGVWLRQNAALLRIPADLIIRLLGALAPMLICFAVLQALIHAKVRGGTAGRLARLLALNTVVAIVIGLCVANLVRPGERWALTTSPRNSGTTPAPSNSSSRRFRTAWSARWWITT